MQAAAMPVAASYSKQTSATIELSQSKQAVAINT